MKFSDKKIIYYIFILILLSLANASTIGLVSTLVGITLMTLSLKSRFLRLTYLILLISIFLLVDFPAGGLFLFMIMSLQIVNKIIVLLSKKQLKSTLIIIFVSIILAAIGYAVAEEFNPTKTFQFYNLFLGGGIALIAITPLLKTSSKRISEFGDKFFE